MKVILKNGRQYTITAVTRVYFDHDGPGGSVVRRVAADTMVARSHRLAFFKILSDHDANLPTFSLFGGDFPIRNYTYTVVPG